MLSYRFALRPRFVIGHVAVLVAFVVMVNLGLWQLRRLDERRVANTRIEARLAASVVDLDSVLGRPVDDVEFRRVRVSGPYAAGADMLLTYRTLEGLSGHHVVTPLVAERGVVLVDRGWVPAEYAERWPVANAVAPRGQVEIVGIVRRSDGGATFVPASGRRRVATMSGIDVGRVERELGDDLAPFWVQLQSPGERDGVPALVPPPDLSEGPHRSYALQWFAFSIMTLGGWAILVRVSARRRALARVETTRENVARPDGSTGA